MQSYRIEELVIRDPKNPKVEKVVAGIDLENVVKYGPYTLLGVPCTILKLANYDVLFPPSGPFLTWVYIAEEFESFSAKMAKLNKVQIDSPDLPDPPPMPPLSTKEIEYMELPTGPEFVLFPIVPPALGPQPETKKAGRPKTAKASKKKR